VVEAIRKLVADDEDAIGPGHHRGPGPAVIVKKVILPGHTGSAVESAGARRGGHLIPDSLDNVNLDYQVIDWIEDGNKMEVLVVAVKREIINSYTEAIRAAELEPVLVDVDYFALENMFELNYDAPEGHPVALVNVGARYSSIKHPEAGALDLHRRRAGGRRRVQRRARRQLGVTPATPTRSRWARGAGRSDSATVGARPRLGDRVHRRGDPARAQLLLDGRHRRAARRRDPVRRPARMPGLAAQLTQRLGCAVEVADPFRRLQLERGVDRQLVEASGPALAVTVGLATRHPGTNDPHQPHTGRRDPARGRTAPRRSRSARSCSPSSCSASCPRTSGRASGSRRRAVTSGGHRGDHGHRGAVRRVAEDRAAEAGAAREAARDRPARGEEGRPRAHPRRPLERDARQALAHRVRRLERHAQAHGLGVDEQTVADFLRKLGTLPFFQTVDLDETSQVDQGGVKLKKFVIRGQIDYGVPAAGGDGSPGQEAGRRRGGGEEMILGVFDDLLERPPAAEARRARGAGARGRFLDWTYFYGPRQGDLAELAPGRAASHRARREEGEDRRARRRREASCATSAPS
jgi:type IV pilus assembly protein PilM